MNKITHMRDNEGNVVIEATCDNNTFCAILALRVIGGIPYIKKSLRFDNPKEFKERIISTIATQRANIMKSL